MSSRTAIAEHYLTMLRGTGDTPTARMTVRFADRARVPFGRISSKGWTSDAHPKHEA